MTSPESKTNYKRDRVNFESFYKFYHNSSLGRIIHLASNNLINFIIKVQIKIKNDQ